jgi:hypothetical protein
LAIRQTGDILALAYRKTQNDRADNKKSPVAAGPPGVREFVKQRMSARSLMDLGRLNLHDKDFHLIDLRQ